MAEELTQGTETNAEGQPAAAPEGASDAGTQAAGGQPEGGGEGATPDGHQDAEPIFDPTEYSRLTKDLPPELQAQAGALQKSLQAAFTKKTQAVAEHRKKIEAYDQFTKNPVRAMERFAQQYGYTLQRPDNQGRQPGGEAKWTPESGDPKSWNDVVEFLKSSLTSDLGGQLQPMVQEFQNIKKQSIEQQLSEIDPGWQQYEDQMMETLNDHPTLAKDPAKLYRLSVPAEIQERRATQRALAKMEAKTKSSSVNGPSSTTKKATSVKFDGKMSFQDAVKAAKAKLSEEGVAA